MEEGYEDDKMMLIEDDIKWCIHILGKTIQSSNNGELSSLNDIQSFLSEMSTKAENNVGKCTLDIPALGKPVPDENHRVIVLIAQTESLMEAVWKLDGKDSTRVHVFNFGLKHHDLKKGLKVKYSKFPNYSDYGELETGAFQRKLLR